MRMCVCGVGFFLIYQSHVSLEAKLGPKYIANGIWRSLSPYIYIICLLHVGIMSSFPNARAVLKGFAHMFFSLERSANMVPGICV